MPPPRPDRPRTVYALLDPRTDPATVFYVGCTSLPLHERFRAHVSAAMHAPSPTRKEDAILDIIRDNEEPTCLVLEELSSTDDWEDAERFWISHFGSPALTNASVGGVGNAGYKHTPGALARIRAALSSEGFKQRMHDLHAGKPKSEETRARMRLAHSDESLRLHKSAVVSNLVWITDGSMNTRIPKGDDIPSGWWPGRTVSDTQRARYTALGAQLKGTKLSEATKQNMRAAQGTAAARARKSQVFSERVWATDGVHNKRVPLGQLPPGWRLGRTLTPAHVASVQKANAARGVSDETRTKLSTAHKARSAETSAAISNLVWINDGTTNKRLPRGEAVPEGWKLGRALSAKQVSMYQSRRKA